MQGQISEHIFAPNEGYCLYYPLNFFRNARSFENWGIFNNYSPKWRWLAVDIYRAAKRRGKFGPFAFCKSCQMQAHILYFMIRWLEILGLMANVELKTFPKLGKFELKSYPKG